ncbi:MAG: AAA family ATPase [Gammaproteobacteria bacterium]
MTTFEQIIPTITATLEQHKQLFNELGAIVINRDLNSRIRLIVSNDVRNNVNLSDPLSQLVKDLSSNLHPHSYPADTMVLYEDNMDDFMREAQGFSLGGFENVIVVDRLTSESRWSKIEPTSKGAPRVVFFSIKGGVGRSTAMAVTAWFLAQQGKKVLVVDLDLESPGLSSSLLPKNRRPTYGITDWLVEDLVDNGDSIIEDMYATSELSHDGEIYVVPAYGASPGDYINKLGRAWMPKLNPPGKPEPWHSRLNRLLNQLENKIKPDVILIDSRSGIDEVASSCVTDIGAKLVLLFAIDGEQTWEGYRVLFEYWKQNGSASEIRERLQQVGAMIPEIHQQEYFSSINEQSCDLYSETLYDEIPAGDSGEDLFNFEKSDSNAPHYPWSIKWNRGFAALSSLRDRVSHIEPIEVQSIFGPLVDGISTFINCDDK